MVEMLFRRRLGEMLLEEGIISGDDIMRAMEYGEETGSPLGRSLMALGMLDESTLAVYLERQLGESLIERGIMDHAQIDGAFDRARSEGGSFGQIIVRLGYVDDEELAQILAEDYDLPCMHIKHLHVDEDVASLMSRDTAVRTLFLPLEQNGDVLTVATARPYDELTISKLESSSGLKVTLLVVPERELAQAIRRYISE